MSMDTTKVVKQKKFDNHHAIVIGGGMAGLLAARVLLEHFERVTILERDPLLDDAEPRKGVPQGRHVHVLLAGGAAILRAYFPDLFATLAQDGAVLVGPSDFRQYQLGLRVASVPGDAKTPSQTRPLLEQHVRACLAARNNVQFLDGCSVMRLRMKDERITGVYLRHRAGEPRDEELAANLVVDASGRGSRAPQWLASSGYGQVEETCVTIQLGYATRLYRCPDSLKSEWKALLISATPPDNKRAGILFPIEGGDWMVTLAGRLRDYPPDDDAGFLEFARSLSHPDLYEAIKEAEPISPIAVYKFGAHRWLRYERLSRLPEGFIVMGDAVCAFNPAYGQGMSVAAREAKILDTFLRDQQSLTGNHRKADFPRLFQKAIVKEIKTPWLLATGQDLRFPGTEGRRSLSTRLFNWYVRHVISLTTTNPFVTATFFQVSHLLKPLRTLFGPRIAWAVLNNAALQPNEL